MDSVCTICYLDDVEVHKPCKVCNIVLCNKCWYDYIKTSSKNLYTISCPQCREVIPIFNPIDIKKHSEVMTSDEPYLYNYRNKDEEEGEYDSTFLKFIYDMYITSDTELLDYTQWYNLFGNDFIPKPRLVLKSIPPFTYYFELELF